MPKYSKRHYEDVARIFKYRRPEDHWDANKRLQHNALLKSFVETFSDDNLRFNTERFIEASGGYAKEMWVG